MKYDRIEIHFRTTKNEPRTVMIDPETDVSVISLENKTGPKQPKAKGLRIVGGKVARNDGPHVCYKTPSGTICW